MEMSIERSLELIQHRIENGQIDGAIDLLRQLLSIEPDLAQAHAYLALCLLGRKRLLVAEQEAKMASALEPAMELTHFALAHINIAHRNFKQAQDHTQELLDMDPISCALLPSAGASQSCNPK
jgi:tetratricopeptide (TPR) repeat protein